MHAAHATWDTRTWQQHIMAAKGKPLPTVSYDPLGQAVMSRYGQDRAERGTPLWKTARWTCEQCQRANKQEH